MVSPTFTMISVTSTSSPPMSGTLTSFAADAAGAAATGAGVAAGAVPEPATSNTMIREPVLTLSPAAILISFTVPANGAGTSIEALSPSTVIRDCSSVMVSPTFTMISVTSTSSPPISGTLTSLLSAATGAAARAAAFCCTGAASAAPFADSKIMISLPVSILSPTATLISLTTPACGDGTSMEALSPSTVISDCSASTVSPAFTRISVTSTSSAPISGTLISIDINLYLLCQTWVNFFWVDVIFFNSFFNDFHINFAAFSQFTQSSNNHVRSINFKVMTQVFTAVRTTETVST